MDLLKPISINVLRFFFCRSCQYERNYVTINHRWTIQQMINIHDIVSHYWMPVVVCSGIFELIRFCFLSFCFNCYKFPIWDKIVSLFLVPIVVMLFMVATHNHLLKLLVLLFLICTPTFPAYRTRRKLLL